jgi:hypothetical protein
VRPHTSRRLVSQHPRFGHVAVTVAPPLSAILNSATEGAVAELEPNLGKEKANDGQCFVVGQTEA